MGSFGVRETDPLTVPSTTAHNIIIGGMWVDHYGTLTFVNHTLGDKCVVRVTKSGWLGSGRFEVQGEVTDAAGNIK